jgi:hypothetical protein
MPSERVQLDLNNPIFLETLFSLERQEVLQVMGALRKISRLDWNQFYRDSGLKWEAIGSKTTLDGQRLYSLRISQKIRAVAYRDGSLLRLQSLHGDHDSAYM